MSSLGIGNNDPDIFAVKKKHIARNSTRSPQLNNVYSATEVMTALNKWWLQLVIGVLTVPTFPWSRLCSESLATHLHLQKISGEARKEGHPHTLHSFSALSLIPSNTWSAPCLLHTLLNPCCASCALPCTLMLHFSLSLSLITLWSAFCLLHTFSDLCFHTSYTMLLIHLTHLDFPLYSGMPFPTNSCPLPPSPPACRHGSCNFLRPSSLTLVVGSQ